MRRCAGKGGRNCPVLVRWSPHTLGRMQVLQAIRAPQSGQAGDRTAGCSLGSGNQRAWTLQHPGKVSGTGGLQEEGVQCGPEALSLTVKRSVPGKYHLPVPHSKTPKLLLNICYSQCLQNWKLFTVKNLPGSQKPPGISLALER